ncbi:hypothetical protein HHI36_022349 [Cryptolaemus montrouzieri]|uniref:Replication protein n=1 Tax=Cryptolaemus montrouzieri TaxID=559131 RepID=A0ABD2N0T6_9CUCU
MSNKMKIIQWNIRIINAIREDLTEFLSEENPDVICPNKTWLKPTQNFHLISYSIMRQDRDDGYGGVATRKDISFDKIKNLHLRILRDLNSYHPLWDKSTTNRGSKVIADFIVDNEFVDMNDGSMTLLQNPNKNVSAIDSTMVNKSTISSKINLEYEATSSVGSYQSRNLNKADWQIYYDSITKLLTNKNLNITYEELIQIINSAADEITPSKISGIVGKIGSAWYDEECKAWTKERRESIENCNTYPTQENFIQAKKNNSSNKKNTEGKETK